MKSTDCVHHAYFNYPEIIVFDPHLCMETKWKCLKYHNQSHGLEKKDKEKSRTISNETPAFLYLDFFILVTWFLNWPKAISYSEAPLQNQTTENIWKGLERSMSGLTGFTVSNYTGTRIQFAVFNEKNYVICIIWRHNQNRIQMDIYKDVISKILPNLSRLYPEIAKLMIVL